MLRSFAGVPAALVLASLACAHTSPLSLRGTSRGRLLPFEEGESDGVAMGVHSGVQGWGFREIGIAARQRPQQGMIITKSTSLRHGTYVVPNNSTDPFTGAITIQGDNITVDFRGVTLEGTPENTPPDQRAGTGISVVGNNVTIKNATVRGYKVGLIAKGASGLRILDSDFSYNYKQHLKSTIEKENEDDWQSYHHNEADEWLRYGAGMYLKGCDNWEVKHTTVTGGQCGLMLVQSNKGLAWNNDFSFNSGIGIGLYRSSDNRVMHNALDWDVRGFSYGYYSRGQDSAGILIYEQSNRNTFAYNSVTHGGDGFFLWAGQSSMDTGEGGCNDNFVYGNDFSHAPANGIEATFSQNTFANNYMRECDYGVWGGYSFNTKILGNWIQDCKHGVAIEHGQNNVIRGDFFRRDATGVQLWANPNQDPSWGYPKHHDTVSHDYEISGNQFSGGDVAFDIKDTKGVKITGNRLQFPGTLFKNASDGITFENNHVTGYGAGTDGFAKSNFFDTVVEAGLAPDWDPYAQDKSYPAEIRQLRPDKLKGGQDPFLPDGAIRGRFNIIVDEWGPYDFRYPRLWPEKPEKQPVDEAGRVPSQARPLVQRFRVLGPAGKWTLKSAYGVDSIQPKDGDVPGYIDVTLPGGKATDLDIELSYTGEKDTFDYLGVKHKASDTIQFGYKEFFVPINWSLSLFPWDAGTDPRTKSAAFSKLIAGKPAYTTKLDRLQFGTSGPFFPGTPADHFATVSTGSVELPEGAYTLEITSDDGCRIWIDGKKVIDEWRYQAPTTFTAPLSGGKHDIRVEHFQIDGYASLIVDVKKAS